LEVNNILQEWLSQERTDAAKHLARRLEWLKRQEEVQKEEDKEDEYNKSVIILAIPGGVIVIDDIIAPELGIKLDVVVSRKIGAPFNPELAIGAVMQEDSYFLNEVADTINVPQDYIDSQIGEQVKEIERWPLPQVTADIRPDDGPVLMQIEYIVDGAKSKDFKFAIEELKNCPSERWSDKLGCIS